MNMHNLRHNLKIAIKIITEGGEEEGGGVVRVIMSATVRVGSLTMVTAAVLAVTADSASDYR